MKAPLLAAALLASAVAARADWRALDAKDFMMDPPPAAGSPQAKAELDELVALQATRTPAQCAEARAEKTPDLASLFGGAGILTDAELAKAQPLVDEVAKRMSAISGVFKKTYARPRPYDEDSRIVPCADKPGGATSYPSGHAAAGVIDACVLSRVFPARAADIEARGQLAGELRIVGGVHHRSDVVAGRALAAAYCGKLLADAGFRQELAAAAR